MIAWLLLGLASAQELSGWMEARGNFQAGVDGRPWQVIGSLRPTLDVPVFSRIKFSVTPQVTLLGGRETPVELRRTLEESELGPLIDAAGCTWPDDTVYAPGLQAIDAQVTVERLFVDAYLPRVDVRVGRQALQWGSGLLINPTDPFPEVLFTEPWRQRRGVNAARVTIPLGEVEQIQAVIATNDTFDKVRVAARGTAHAGEFDISLVGAWRQDDERGVLGFDVKGTAVVGLWFEGALLVGGQDKTSARWDGRFVTGLDYSFPVLERIMIGGQYVFQSDGSLDGDDPTALTGRLTADGTTGLPDCGPVDVGALFGAPGAQAPADTGSDTFQSPLSGKHYVLLNLSLGFIPELALGLVDLHNLGDGTGVFVPTLSARPTGWLSLSASAQVPYRLWGDGGEFKPASETTTLTVEPVPGNVLTADLGGLVPEASVSIWTRANF